MFRVPVDSKTPTRQGQTDTRSLATHTVLVVSSHFLPVSAANPQFNSRQKIGAGFGLRVSLLGSSRISRHSVKFCTFLYHRRQWVA
jgi:hypothetical protein